MEVPRSLRCRASRAIVGQTKQDGEERAKEKPKAIPVKRSSRSSGGMSLAKFTGTSSLRRKLRRFKSKKREMKKVASSLTSLDKAHKVSQGVHGGSCLPLGEKTG